MDYMIIEAKFINDFVVTDQCIQENYIEILKTIYYKQFSFIIYLKIFVFVLYFKTRSFWNISLCGFESFTKK